MPRKKTKKKKEPYFGMKVQDAIIRYNALDSIKEQSKRNKIYQEEIHAAFDKLSENIINTFKFSYFDDPFMDVKHEVVAFMVMNIHKYDHTKGSKAFSYFSVVAKNYLILHNNNNYKKLKTHSDITALTKPPSVSMFGSDSEEFYSDISKELIKYFEETIPTMFKKKRDMDIAYAILELLKKQEEIENFNKKALYILIREMTNVKTNEITKVVNVLKKHYRKIVYNYNNQNHKNKNSVTKKFF
tara:strand:+ start:271 stop:999 length:729 start_codon:yes stop_codon:yes gene_type:complete